MMTRMHALWIALLCGMMTPVATAQERSADQLWQQAVALTKEGKHADGATRYRSLIERFPADARVKAGTAHQRLAAALGRLRRYGEAGPIYAALIAAHPKHAFVPRWLYFGGVYLRMGGKAKLGTELLQRLIKDFPDDVWAGHARRALSAKPGRRSSSPIKKSNLEQLGEGRFRVLGKPLAAVPGGPKAASAYVVLAGMDEDDPYHAAARRLATHRGGTVVSFDPLAPSGVKGRLQALGARYVAVVVKPVDMDANLLRRMIQLSISLDADPFCDFAFGFITGRTAATTLAWVDQIIKADSVPLPRRHFSSSVISGPRSMLTRGSGLALVKRAGFSEGGGFYLSCQPEEGSTVEFFRKHREKLNGGGLISQSGCGDPTGIWLFSDRRNAQREKHWPFDPRKIGHDPSGEMPRLLAKHFRGLKLFPSVYWSGVCHLGSVDRIFIAGDIVSTYGSVDKVTAHRIGPENSIAVTLMEQGAVSLLVALGPNHGWHAMQEKLYALESGDRMGDVMRWSYHWMVMDSTDGELEQLAVKREGAAFEHKRSEIFAGAPQNRLLYGDPYYKPFARVKQPNQETRVVHEAGASSFEVHTTYRSAAFQLSAVINEMDRANGNRICCAVEVPVRFGALRVKTATASDREGKPLTLTRVIARLERIDGKQILHLNATAPGKTLDRDGASVRFAVEVEAEAEAKE